MGVLRTVTTLLLFFNIELLALESSLTTSLGQNLSPEEKRTSFSFEPDFTHPLSENITLGAYSLIDRPTNPYLNFEVPKTILSLSQNIFLIDALKTKIVYSINFLSLDRWAADGYTLRPTVGFSGEKEISKGLTLSGKLSLYGQANEFNQTTSGSTLPKYGITERLMLNYSTGNWELEALFLLDQQYTSLWKNQFATLESISYMLNESLSAGISHEYLGSMIDSSTGYSKGIRFFDDRESRISAQLKVRI